MLTDERIHELWNASTKFINGYGQPEIMEFARAVEAEASPASVPEVTDGMAIAFHNAMTDGSIGQSEVDEIKTGLRAAIAAAPTPPVIEARWQPIETAPKYGRFLAVMPSGVISVIVWLEASHPDADGEGWYEHWKFDPVDPTHWMPLPKAPAMQEDKP